jgi:hypothetical protein
MAGAGAGSWSAKSMLLKDGRFVGGP